MTIRAFRVEDREAAYALYHAAMGDLWPVPPARFHAILQTSSREQAHLVATRAGRIVGLVAIQPPRASAGGSRQGAVPLLMVAPAAQRQAACASEILKARGVGNSHIGWTWLLELYGRLGYRP